MRRALVARASALTVPLAVMLLTSFAEAAATYDGTLNASFSILGCARGNISLSCSLAGLTFTGNADSPLQFFLADGAATASATGTVSSFGPGTFTTDASGDLVGTGLSEGSGYSTSFAIHGQANASGAVSLAQTFLAFFAFNRGGLSTSVDFLLSFQYLNTIAIGDPATDGALSRSHIDVAVQDVNATPPVGFLELFQSECGNMNPPNFIPGFASSGTGPCSANVANQVISFVFAPCQNPNICVGGFAEAQVIQQGIAQVTTVPHPSTLVLLALGSIVWRIAHRRRR